jgi:hypothetical protein
MFFNKLILLTLILLAPGLVYSRQNFTIILDPAGDTKHIGRALHNNFERSATFQFAQELKRQIQINYPQVNVILSKTAGQTLEKLQSASFANRLNVDLVLSLNFYKETAIKPYVFLYHFKNQNFFSVNKTDQLEFYPYHQAFMINFDRTKTWGATIQKSLQHANYRHYFTCHQLLAIPFKPLAGIVPPAIGIEIGIKTNGWEPYIMPIVNSLSEIIYAL